MKEQTGVMKSDHVNLANAREFITRLAREAGASESAVTKIEMSCDEWNASIREHALSNGAGKGFTIEYKGNDKKFMTIFLQSKVIDVFQLPSFTKFFKRIMDVDGVMFLIKGETQETTMVETIDGPEDSVFPLIFQCPRCGKKFKTMKPGKFRCSSCSSIISINPGGKVSSG
jgi:anti-sigma B factor antagonist